MKRLVWFLAVSLVLGLALTGIGPTAGAAEKLPSAVSMATMPVGSVSYSLNIAMGNPAGDTSAMSPPAAKLWRGSTAEGGIVARGPEGRPHHHPIPKR